MSGHSWLRAHAFALSQQEGPKQPDKEFEEAFAAYLKEEEVMPDDDRVPEMRKAFADKWANRPDAL